MDLYVVVNAIPFVVGARDGAKRFLACLYVWNGLTVSQIWIL
jgi:hypothetical protein